MEAHLLRAAPGDRRASRRRRPRRAWRRLVAFGREWSVAGPTVFAGLAATLLIYNHVEAQVTDLAFWLGLALVGSVFTWLVQNNHRRARVDALTELPNRLQLSADLRGLSARSAPRALVLLELDGVASYRERLGFEAGDELLQRFAAELAEMAERLGGRAYRLDGPQFSFVVSSEGREPGEIEMALAAIPASEKDAPIGCAQGVVMLPADATDRHLILQLAGQRVAAAKRHQRRSAKHQAHDALMAVLNARRPEMAAHLRTVAFHAIAVGRRLGLGRDQLDDVVFAAKLQHIGVLAVSDAALAREAGRSAAESEVIRNLPTAGARIVAAAPALASVAALIRSSYESYDGSGYPDGLSGDRIPLGARIIAVCGAYAVMTARGADGHTRSPEEALRRLRQAAGNEYDPRVVEALAADLAEDELPPPQPDGDGRSPLQLVSDQS